MSFKLHFALLFTRTFMPVNKLRRTRTHVLRWAGLPVRRSTTIYGDLTIIMSRRYDLCGLQFGENVRVNDGVLFDLSDVIILGHNVAIGPRAKLITTNHEIGPSDNRCGPNASAPIEIGDGAWIGTDATILPGVVIGAGAVIASGSEVTKDVPSNTLVAGVPARFIKNLP